MPASKKLVLNRETIRRLGVPGSGPVPMTGISNTGCLCSESGCDTGASVTICTA